MKCLPAPLVMTLALLPWAAVAQQPAPAVSQPDTAARTTSAAPAARLRLDLNLPEMRLRLYQGDRFIKSYRVAIGDTAYPTPTGRFAIYRVEWDPWWRPPASDWAAKDTITPPGPLNPMGRVRFPFFELYFVHGNPDRMSIGRPASHGCVRMLNEDAVDLALHITRLHAPGVTAARRRELASRRGDTTTVVKLAAPVPITLRYDISAVQAGRVVIYRDVYRRLTAPDIEDATFRALSAAGYQDHLDSAAVRAMLDRAAGAGVSVDVNALLKRALPVDH